MKSRILRDGTKRTFTKMWHIVSVIRTLLFLFNYHSLHVVSVGNASHGLVKMPLVQLATPSRLADRPDVVLVFIFTLH